MPENDFSSQSLEQVALWCLSNQENADGHGELYRRLSMLTYWRAKSRLPRQAKNDAADVVQEVFLRLREKLNLYDRQRPFLPWFQTLADNVARDYARKILARPPTVSDEEIPPASVNSLLMSLETSEENIQKLLLRLMTTLETDEERRFAVELFKDKPIEDICADLNFQKTKAYKLRRRIIDLCRELARDLPI